ncbi:MAG: class 3-domain-containing protein [Monoraphidium minutum]|nr:MAG: class 3-domain-containing protein [Monoraphidium minutum]
MAPRPRLALLLLVAAAAAAPRGARGQGLFPLFDALPSLFGSFAPGLAPGAVRAASAGAAPAAAAAPAPAAPLALPSMTSFAPLLQAAFQAFCPVLPIDVPPFPLRADALCASTGMDRPGNSMACMIFDTLGSMFTNMKLQCAPEAVRAPGSVDAQGRAVPQPLADRRTPRGLPTSLPAAKVLQEEGATLGWLFKSVQRLQLWGHCGALGKRGAWAAPEGWEALGAVAVKTDLRSYGLNASSVPMVGVLRQGAAARTAACGAAAAKASAAGRAARAGAAARCGGEGGHLVVVIRGTASAPEWDIDFDYSMEKDARYGPGLLHRGFLAVANEVWDNGLKAMLDSEVVDSGAAADITLTGHSMGAALATLLGARAQAYLKQRTKGSTAWKSAAAGPLVSVAVFGAPNVGDSEFAAHFDANVNARNVNFEYDFVAQMPCAPVTTSCSNLKKPTTNAQGFWPYARVGGRVLLAARDMPVQSDAWRRTAVYRQADMCANPQSAEWMAKAAHICAYDCALSAALGEADNSCLLWPARGAAEAASSYCLHGFAGAFPHTQPALFPEP